MKKVLVFFYDIYREVTLFFHNHYIHVLKGVDFHTEKKMEFSREVGLWHEPTRKSLFHKAMRLIDFDDSQQQGFFDIGCGKGNVLIEAHKYSFARIGGVELSQKMYDVCLRNLRAQGLASDQVIQKNAVELSKELDDYDIFYLYNPFKEQVVAEVVANLASSWQRSPRKITVIYHNPKHGDVLEDNGFSLGKKLNEHHLDATRKVYFYERG